MCPLILILLLHHVSRRITIKSTITCTMILLILLLHHVSRRVPTNINSTTIDYALYLQLLNYSTLFPRLVFGTIICTTINNRTIPCFQIGILVLVLLYYLELQLQSYIYHNTIMIILLRCFQVAIWSQQAQYFVSIGAVREMYWQRKTETREHGNTEGWYSRSIPQQCATCFRMPLNVHQQY